jgi:hypothetical protein
VEFREAARRSSCRLLGRVKRLGLSPPGVLLEVMMGGLEVMMGEGEEVMCE